MKKKVCIVTPDLVGPVKNGGIGTHAYYLSIYLAKQDNFDVTVVFTGQFEYKNVKYWKEYFSKININFVAIEDNKKGKIKRYSSASFLDKSIAVYEYLAQEKYDFIHFQEWKAHGFISIQAKVTGMAFYDTILTVTMHSPTQWINQGMEKWYKSPLTDAKISWCERFCCAHADILLSPSEHMIDWATNNNWELSKNRKIIPLIYEKEQNALSREKKYNFKHLIFFGRLETRKGLKLFCDAIEQLGEECSILFEKISFLGKIGIVGKENGVRAIKQISKKYPTIKFDIRTRFDTFQALTYIKETGGIVVMPSLHDNYPFTVIECIENNIPFIASDVGGIPEMANEEVLFGLNINSLIDKLQHLEKINFKNIKHRYSKSIATTKWIDLHKIKTDLVQHDDNSLPAVSVCVPYYNHAEFLPQLLKSLENQTYSNFEVVIVNDGSTVKTSKKVFLNMKKLYEKRGWKFYDEENRGVIETRKFAVENSTHEYIIFMDSDNIATKDMIDNFVKGLQYTNADCLSCHMSAFVGNGPVNNNTKPYYSYIPIGSCLELGYLENVFGDVNFIIKKDVFLKLGGFIKNRTWEDWEFLARLNLEGYKHYVIPKQLFWYRHLENSRRRLSMHLDYRKHLVLINTYRNYGPKYLNFTFPLIISYKTNNKDYEETKNAIDKDLTIIQLVNILLRVCLSFLAKVKRVINN